jgi:hypothetical protein
MELFGDVSNGTLSQGNSACLGSEESLRGRLPPTLGRTTTSCSSAAAMDYVFTCGV